MGHYREFQELKKKQDFRRGCQILIYLLPVTYVMFAVYFFYEGLFKYLEEFFYYSFAFSILWTISLLNGSDEKVRQIDREVNEYERFIFENEDIHDQYQDERNEYLADLEAKNQSLQDSARIRR